MAASALLQSKLSSPPSNPFVRRAILDRVFFSQNSQPECRKRQGGFTAYFTHWYEEQCNDRIGEISTTTHSTLADIVCLVKDRNGEKESIRRQIKAILPNYSDESVEVLISLAARLWTMACIGEIKQCLTLGQTLIWRDGSLMQLLASTFTPNLATKEDVVLPKSFNAMSCEKVAGIRIHWTSNLLDHLKMTDEDQTVYIFHHAAFLDLHKQISRFVGVFILNRRVWAKTSIFQRNLPGRVPRRDH